MDVPRPTYETPLDLKNEEAVVKAVYKEVGCTAYWKLKKYYPVDFALIKGFNIAYFAEVKCRTKPHDFFKTYMISLDKFNWLLTSHFLHRTKSILIVRWTDVIGLLEFPPPDHVVRMGGRDDRGDPQDFEPMAHIPIKYFRMLKSGEENDGGKDVRPEAGE